MKYLITYILLTTTLMHLFYSSGYLLDYYVNTDFYLENCENKNRPELNCDGQCILAKKMAAADPVSDSDEFAPVPHNFEYVFILSDVELINPYKIRKYSSFWNNNYHFEIVSSILKPPIG